MEKRDRGASQGEYGEGGEMHSFFLTLLFEIYWEDEHCMVEIKAR